MIPLLKNRLFFISFGASASINILLWVILFSKFGFSNEPILFTYSVVSGIDLVGGSNNVYFLPMTALVIFGVNVFIANFFFIKEMFISAAFAVATVLVHLIFLISSILVIAVNP